MMKVGEFLRGPGGGTTLTYQRDQFLGLKGLTSGFFDGLYVHDTGLDRYEALLDCPDADLFDWITGRAPPPPEYDTDVTRLLLAFRFDPRAT